MITQKMVKEVKRHIKKQWHNAAWHEYQGRPETMAILWAIDTEGEAAHLRDIVETAKNYKSALKRAGIK